MSLVESVANVFVGYWVAVLSQIAVFPLFGLYVTVRDTLLIGGIFTGISIARSYALRRLFEAIRVQQTIPNAGPRRWRCRVCANTLGNSWRRIVCYECGSWRGLHRGAKLSTGP